MLTSTEWGMGRGRWPLRLIARLCLKCLMLAIISRHTIMIIDHPSQGDRPDAALMIALMTRPDDIALTSP